MDLRSDYRTREIAMVGLLTLSTLLLSPLLVVAGALLYLASVVGLNVIVLNESTHALAAWASGSKSRR